MQRPPYNEIRKIYRAESGPEGLDNATAARLKTQFAVLSHLAEAAVLPSAPVALVCVEQELEAWLSANQRAVSALLSTPAHPFTVSKVKAPDKVMRPKAAMLGHFDKARRWRYDDKVDALRVLKATDIDLPRMHRTTSFAPFEAKLLACVG
jgi:hypothetical protein